MMSPIDLPDGMLWARTIARGVAWEQVIPLLLPLPVVVLANVADRWRVNSTNGAGGDVKRGTSGPGVVGFGPPDSTAGLATWVVLLLAAAVVVVLGAATAVPAIVHLGSRGQIAYGCILVLTGLGAAVTLLEPVRSRLRRLLPLDPASAVHGAALVLSVILLGSQLGAVLALNPLAGQGAGRSPLGPVDLVAQEIPYLLAALLGVGLFVRRGAAAAFARLGFVRPTAWQVLLALAAAGLFYAFSSGASALGERLTPDLAHQVQTSTQRLFGGLANPAGIMALALAPGLCEEALFRGALQPRLGVVWTAVLFAAVHTEYGFSFDTVAVLVLAFCLAALRRYANTSTSALSHVAYNGLAGVGVSAAWLLPAMGIEALLVTGAGAAWLFTTRLGRATDPG